MATLADILSPVWTLSLQAGGAIAEGIEAIKQCITIILRTTPGSDPLRPTFGCGLFQYVDMPINVAVPNLKKAMLDGISQWEDRVTVTKITSIIGDVGEIIFNIGYTLVDGTLSDSLTVSVGSGGVSVGTASQRIILRALIPASGTGLQYQVSAIIGGSPASPIPPESGFATIDDLYTWVVDNWLNYGQWYLTADSLVGYLNPAFTSGSLNLSLLSVRQLSAVIPPGASYTVTVVDDGVTYSNSGMVTAADILAYVQGDSVLGTLGTWSIATAPDDFGDDFSDDFDTYSYSVQLITESTDEITLTITAD